MQLQFTCTDTFQALNNTESKTHLFQHKKASRVKKVCVCATSQFWKLLFKENNDSSFSSKSRQDSMVVMVMWFLCSRRDVVKSEMNKHWNCFEDGLVQKNSYCNSYWSPDQRASCSQTGCCLVWPADELKRWRARPLGKEWSLRCPPLPRNTQTVINNKNELYLTTWVNCIRFVCHLSTNSVLFPKYGIK